MSQQYAVTSDYAILQVFSYLKTSLFSSDRDNLSLSFGAYADRQGWL
ncbi:hypothetical protein [Microseira sp. BLCC-F43]|jgi:hypothetical protein